MVHRVVDHLGDTVVADIEEVPREMPEQGEEIGEPHAVVGQSGALVGSQELAVHPERVAWARTPGLDQIATGDQPLHLLLYPLAGESSSDERRAGKECVSTGRSRW